MFDLSLLACPSCGGEFSLDGEALVCRGCGARASARGGIGGFLEAINDDDYCDNYEQICADDLKEPKTPDIVKEIFTRLVTERAAGTVCDLGCGDGFVVRQV